MNRYLVAVTTDIDLERDNGFQIKIKMYYSFARIELLEGAELFEGVNQYKVVKVLANTKDNKPILKEGDEYIQFNSEGLEFENDEAALLWFRLTHEI